MKWTLGKSHIGSEARGLLEERGELSKKTCFHAAHKLLIKRCLNPESWRPRHLWALEATPAPCPPRE